MKTLTKKRPAKMISLDAAQKAYTRALARGASTEDLELLSADIDAAVARENNTKDESAKSSARKARVQNDSQAAQDVRMFDMGLGAAKATEDGEVVFRVAGQDIAVVRIMVQLSIPGFERREFEMARNAVNVAWSACERFQAARATNARSKAMGQVPVLPANLDAFRESLRDQLRMAVAAGVAKVA